MDRAWIKKLTPTESLEYSDRKENRLLREMHVKATQFITGQKWCPRIECSYLAFGVGGVIAVFLFKFAEKVRGTDDALWVVVGDLPSAYFVVDQAHDARAAMRVYCELMEQWVHGVLDSTGLDGVYPVDATPTKANANALKTRIRLLREHFIPSVK